MRDLSAFYERVRGEVPIESLKASWLIYGDGFAQDRLRTVVKRIFDATLAAILLLLSLPVMFLAGVAIFVESGGPIFLWQERVGRGGRSFLCVKFRSMRVDAEGDGVARWASANDSRITRVGRILRKLRIDELPQLFNVLSGEMSLVGPRPERPPFVAELKEQHPLLRFTSFHQARCDRMGANSLPVWILGRRRAAQAAVRPVLRQESLAGPGCAVHHGDS